jgi:hypothetical protein
MLLRLYGLLDPVRMCKSGPRLDYRIRSSEPRAGAGAQLAAGFLKHALSPVHPPRVGRGGAGVNQRRKPRSPASTVQNFRAWLD